MPVHRQARRGRGTVPASSHLWPSAGRHVWLSGDGSDPQTHDRGHLVHAATGVLALQTASGLWIVPADRVAWTPAGVAHQHRAHGDTDMRIVFLAQALARRLPRRPAVFEVSDLAREVLRALTDPGVGGVGPAYDAAALSRLRRVLVDELREEPGQPLRLPEPHDDRLRALAARLYDDPADSRPLVEHGRAIGASVRTVSRLLHAELGMTFYEWRTQIRLYHALVLLAEGKDVTGTAHACGWSNPSAFIEAFTAVLGMTPGRYQKRAGPVTTRTRAVQEDVGEVDAAVLSRSLV